MMVLVGGEGVGVGGEREGGIINHFEVVGNIV